MCVCVCVCVFISCGTAHAHAPHCDTARHIDERMCVYIYMRHIDVCMYVYMYIRKMDVRMYLHMYVCVCVCVCVCFRLCVRVYTATRRHPLLASTYTIAATYTIRFQSLSHSLSLCRCCHRPYVRIPMLVIGWGSKRRRQRPRGRLAVRLNTVLMLCTCPHKLRDGR